MKQVYARQFFPDKKASAVVTENGVEMEYGRINREDRKQLLEDAARGSMTKNTAAADGCHQRWPSNSCRRRTIDLPRHSPHDATRLLPIL